MHRCIAYIMQNDEPTVNVMMRVPKRYMDLLKYEAEREMRKPGPMALTFLIKALDQIARPSESEKAPAA